MMEETSKILKPRGGSVSMFPGRLHDLLEYVESQNMDHIVSWCRNGTAFMVHRPDELLQILSFFFGQTKYRSFTRQLNMWFFEREEYGPYKGAYHHPYFLKENKELCAKMSRNCSPDRRLFTRAVDELSCKSTNDENCQKAFMPICDGLAASKPFDDSLQKHMMLFMSPREPESMFHVDFNPRISPRLSPQADFSWPEPCLLFPDDIQQLQPSFARSPSPPPALMDDSLFSINEALEPNPIRERRASILSFAALFNARTTPDAERVSSDGDHQEMMVAGVKSASLTQDEDGLYLLRLLQGEC